MRATTFCELHSNPTKQALKDLMKEELHHMRASPFQLQTLVGWSPSWWGASLPAFLQHWLGVWWWWRKIYSEGPRLIFLMMASPLFLCVRFIFILHANTLIHLQFINRYHPSPFFVIFFRGLGTSLYVGGQAYVRHFLGVWACRESR